MGGGPGEAVPHDQAAGVVGGAANLGTQLANSPDIVNNIIHDLTTKGLANNPQNFWQALATAGFATMASRSPFALQAIGEGASAGMDAYNKMRQQRAGQMTTAADLAQRQQTYGLEERKQAAEEKLLPYQIAREQAYANYLGDRGGYFQRGGGRGGAGSMSEIRQSVHDAYIANMEAQGKHVGDDDAWLYAQRATSPAALDAREKYRASVAARFSANPLTTFPDNPEMQAQLVKQQEDEIDAITDQNADKWMGASTATKPSTAPSAAGLQQQAQVAINTVTARADLTQQQKDTAIAAIKARLAGATGAQ
jgi:hypothetical protein